MMCEFMRGQINDLQSLHARFSLSSQWIDDLARPRSAIMEHASTRLLIR
jgi:hypothetical protein